MKEDAAVSTRIVWYFILLGLLSVVATGVTYALKPTWLGFERKAFKESHQYIETHRGTCQRLIREIRTVDKELVGYEANVRELEAKEQPTDKEIRTLTAIRELVQTTSAQRTALINELRETAGKLPDKEVPSGAYEFINK